MSEIILSGINLNDLLDKIGQIVKTAIDKKMSATQAKEDFIYITRKETAAILKISLPTLNDWTKRGILHSYKISTRILYKRDDIQNSLSVRDFLKYKN